MDAVQKEKRVSESASQRGNEQSGVAVPREVAERWAGKLLEMFVPEQVDQLLEVMQVTFDVAVIREFDQQFYIWFSKKGYPLKFGGTNDVKPFNPKMYNAE